MSELPSGTVSFLFTDIEGSTKLAQAHPDQWESLREKHHASLREAIESHNGYVFQIIGDAFCAAFHTVKDGLNAAIQAQRVLQTSEFFKNSEVSLRVRMGLHTGSAELHDNDYRGYMTLARVQRVMSVAYGGQILLSNASAELIHSELPEEITLRDMKEHRLKGLLNPERLWQIIATDLQQDFPPLQSLNEIPNNLPTQLTSFIGRENEIAELKQEIESHRLVTLTGSGGTGKTRLSLQVAADLLDSFPNGVWLIELAPLTDPDLIPQTILSTIGVSEQPNKTPLEILKEYLHDKKVLIVLDNCEHLVTASAQVANALLNAAPNLKILASSREALGVKGELSYPVPSLSLPDVKHLPAIEQLSQYEAVRLFIDRALLVTPHFVVDKDNAPFIAQICHRLDGIPLAIELAAARVKMMSVEQISKRLDDRFRLLTGGARTSLPRQQTLRALIDWSYDILTDNERLLLCRLSVFAGGWTLEAAEDVCAGDGIESYEVLDLLTQLVNKSLVVVVEHSQSGEMRYRMLETIRQYTREKLLEAGGSKRIRDKHLDYYLQIVKRVDQESFSPKELDWLVWLGHEWDNLRSAVNWSLESRPVAGLNLVVNLGNFLLEHFYTSDAENWLSQLLPNSMNSARTILRAHGLLLWVHCIELGREDLSPAQSIIEEARSICDDLNDNYGIAQSYRLEGLLQFALGRPNRGNMFLEKALDLFRETNNKPWMANTLLLFGWSLETNDIVRKLSCIEESLLFYRELGYISGMIEALKQLGAIELRQGHFEKAHFWLDEAFSLLQSHVSIFGDSKTVSYDVGDLAFYEGNYLLAQEHYENCLSWAEKTAQPVSVGYAKVRLGYLYLRLGEMQSAVLFLHEALLSFRTIGNSYGISITLDGLASLAVVEHQWAKAVKLFAHTAKKYEDVHGPRPPVEQEPVEKDLATIRSKITDTEFIHLSAEGRTMTEEQAIALALEE